jgi:hypothetical protein
MVPIGTLFRGSFFLGLSQKLTSTPRPLLRSGAPFLLAPCRARCRRDTPLAFHSISEERLVRQARYTVACKHRWSRGLQVDGLTAAEMVDRAHKATTAIDKRRLLQLAEKWLDLAERSERVAAQPQRPIGDHPLVRRALGNS